MERTELEKIRVRASREGQRVPRPLNRGAPITHDAPVLVEASDYYRRRVRSGELEVVDDFANAPRTRNAVHAPKTRETKESS
jgi:hypothetical protein